MLRVNEALLAPRAAGSSLRERFGSLAFNWNALWLVLHLEVLHVFALLRIHYHGWGPALSHLSDKTVQITILPVTVSFILTYQQIMLP